MGVGYVGVGVAIEMGVGINGVDMRASALKVTRRIITKDFHIQLFLCLLLILFNL
jgi:hypothetical protein